MASKYIGHVWFTGNSNIGIVLCFDEITQKPKAYINTIVGYDVEYDIQHIMESGMKFPVLEAVTLIKDHGTVIEEDLYNKIVDDLLVMGEEEINKLSGPPDIS